MKPALLSALIAVVAAGCPAPHVPGPADTAAYLGLGDGASKTYADQAGDHIDESIAVRTSSILPGADNPDGLVFDLIAAKAGFNAPDETLSLEVLTDGARIVQFFDCVSKCGLPATKIDIGKVPFKAGTSKETESDVALTEGGVDSTVHETHLFVVGDESGVTVPAGDFQAFSLSWTKTDPDGSKTAVLKISEGDGIVSWDGFAGAQLRLK